MNKVNCHSVPKVIIGSLFSNKVMNIHGIPLTDSVHTVLCLDKRLKIRQINTNLYDCGVSWLVQHLLKLDPVSANQNKEQRTSDTVVCRTHEWISSPLASLCSVSTAFCDYYFSLVFFKYFIHSNAVYDIIWEILIALTPGFQKSSANTTALASVRVRPDSKTKLLSRIKRQMIRMSWNLFRQAMRM